MEIYVNISGFPNYQISNYGNVKNVKTNKVLHPGDNGKGYLYVNLRKSNKTHPTYIHRLVASEFLSNIENLPQVNHKDENTKNNNVNNLEWCTNTYNVNYGTATERMKRKLGTPVKCVETGECFNSMREAARSVKRPHNNLLSVIDNPNRTAAGFHWITIK